LEREGICVLFGDRVDPGRVHGWRARGDAWEEASSDSLLAVHDRYPSQSRKDNWNRLREQLGDPLFGNPPSLTLLCKDKLLCQEFVVGAGLDMPEVEGDPALFEAALARWGSAFLKPRWGSSGEGVRLIRAADQLPGSLQARDWILQRAVRPPDGLAGMALRILVQREPAGGWWMGPIVARRSRRDPVVNAARGAQVLPASEAISADCAASVGRQSQGVAAAVADLPEGTRAVELGLDFVVDSSGEAQLIEVNSCPRGRLLYLARQDPETWAETHQAACERPLRRLLALAPEGKRTSPVSSARPASGRA
jgi:glutathione synthase/RimK-type ligase-like ATP-grasp enzyme